MLPNRSAPSATVTPVLIYVDVRAAVAPGISPGPVFGNVSELRLVLRRPNLALHLLAFAGVRVSLTLVGLSLALVG